MRTNNGKVLVVKVQPVQMFGGQLTEALSFVGAFDLASQAQTWIDANPGDYYVIPVAIEAKSS